MLIIRGNTLTNDERAREIVKGLEAHEVLLSSATPLSAPEAEKIIEVGTSSRQAIRDERLQHAQEEAVEARAHRVTLTQLAQEFQQLIPVMARTEDSFSKLAAQRADVYQAKLRLLKLKIKIAEQRRGRKRSHAETEETEDLDL
jgi:hypothetical protein